MTDTHIEHLAAEWHAAELAAEQTRQLLRVAVWRQVQQGATHRPLGRRIGVSGETVRKWCAQVDADLDAQRSPADVELVAGQLALLDS